MKILIAADGSLFTRAAARYVARHVGAFTSPVEVHVLHVRPPLPYPGAVAAIGRKAVDEYQRDESLKALLAAERELDGANVPYTSSWRVGEPAHDIALFARDGKYDLVVTGSHGLGALANLAMGSVATKLVAASSVPVLVITREAARQKPIESKAPAAARVPSIATP